MKIDKIKNVGFDFTIKPMKIIILDFRWFILSLYNF